MSRYSTPADVWAEVPTTRCKGLCAECCGPIGIYGAEAEAMLAAGHELPVLTRTERDTYACSHLVSGRCSVYDVRPLICRLWGTVKALRCPHGCRPVHWLGDARVRRLFDAIRRLDPSIYASGAGRFIGPDAALMDPTTWGLGDDFEGSEFEQAFHDFNRRRLAAQTPPR